MNGGRCKQTGCGPPRRGFTLFELLVVLALLGLLVGLGWPALQRSLVRARLRHAARMLKVQLAKTRLKAIRTGVPYRFSYQPGGSQFQLAPLGSQPAGSSEVLPADAWTDSTPAGLSSDSSPPSFGASAATAEEPTAAEPLAAGCDMCEACEPLWLPQGVTFADPAVEEFVENSSLSESLAQAAAGQQTAASTSMGPVRLDAPPWVIQWNQPPPVQTELVEAADTGSGLATGAALDTSSGAGSFSSGTTGAVSPPADSSTASAEEMLVPLIFQPDGQTQNARLTLLGPRGYRVDIFVRGLTGEIWVSDIYRVVPEDTALDTSTQPTDQTATAPGAPPPTGPSGFGQP